MSLAPLPFEDIKSGKKTIEARLFDEKRQQLNIEDTITFTKLPEKEQKITVKILDLSRFATFEDMFTGLGVKPFGYSVDQTLQEAVEDMKKYYTKQEEAKYGVLGIHIKTV